MKTIKSVLFLFVLLNSLSANALSTRIGIEYLTVETGGGVTILVEEDVICNNPIVYFDVSMPGFERVFAMLLAYQALEKDIRVFYTCENGKPVVTAIRNADNHNAHLYN